MLNLPSIAIIFVLLTSVVGALIAFSDRRHFEKRSGQLWGLGLLLIQLPLFPALLFNLRFPLDQEALAPIFFLFYPLRFAGYALLYYGALRLSQDRSWGVPPKFLIGWFALGSILSATAFLANAVPIKFAVLFDVILFMSPIKFLVILALANLAFGKSNIFSGIRGAQGGLIILMAAIAVDLVGGFLSLLSILAHPEFAWFIAYASSQAWLISQIVTAASILVAILYLDQVIKRAKRASSEPNPKLST